jgi:putative sporulation protein YtxC
VQDSYGIGILLATYTSHQGEACRLSAIMLVTSTYATAVDEWLEKEKPIVSHEGLQVIFTKVENDKYHQILCECKAHDKSAEEVFLYYVASALTGVVLTTFEAAEALRRLKQKLKAVSSEEREKMIDQILHTLRHNYQKRQHAPRTHVILDLLNYLTMYRTINLEGFIRFRLKDYQEQIAAVVSEAIAEYQARLEHQELVELLQYFMDAQEPKIDQVEVVLDLGGYFRLLDENQNVIDNHYLAGFVDDLLPGTVDTDDLLISALVTLAPVHVRCHCKETAPVLETLQAVFTDRFSLCQGCSICTKSITHQNKRLPVRNTVDKNW